jgi:hypothetical protein
MLVTLVIPAGCATSNVRKQVPEGLGTVAKSIEGDRETVVLLHGLGRSKGSMEYLGRHLKSRGFEVVLWSYPSLKWTVEQAGRRLLEDLAYLNASERVSKLHLVGHSLGGIVIRRALLYGVPSKMGRVVQLAPPNRGSPRARGVGAFLGKVVAPLEALSDLQSSGVNQMGTVELVPIGVIAGDRDWTVPVPYTRLAGAADHVAVACGHTFIMRDRDALRQVEAFLREGRFERE